MKKWCLFLSLYFSLCLLAACAASGSGVPVPGGTPAGEEQSGGETTQPAAVEEPPAGANASAYPVTLRCRIVDGAGTDTLLLAERDGGAGAVYTMPTQGLQVFQGGGSALPEELENGMLVDVIYGGDVMASYPAQFGGDAKLVVKEGFDDRCRLYLDVLEDLWEVDSGLNSDGMTYVGVDLSQTSLFASERSAVAWAFAQAHGAELVEGTYEELAEQGYFTAEPLEGSDAKLWYWEDGCLFSIRDKEDAAFSLPAMGMPDAENGLVNAVCFDAQKWRSGTGAYYFVDCTASQSADGVWSGYTVGSQAIS